MLRAGGSEPAVDVGRKSAVVFAGDHLDASDPAQRFNVLGAAGVVGDDDPDSSRWSGPADLPHQPRDQLGVPVARDHDCHWAAITPVPGDRRRDLGAGSGPEPQVAAQRREPERKGERPVGERTETAILVREVDAAAQIGELTVSAAVHGLLPCAK